MPAQSGLPQRFHHGGWEAIAALLADAHVTDGWTAIAQCGFDARTMTGFMLSSHTGEMRFDTSCSVAAAVSFAVRGVRDRP